MLAILVSLALLIVLTFRKINIVVWALPPPQSWPSYPVSRW